MNPYADTGHENVSSDEVVGLEGARVVTAPEHVAGDNVGHAVEVKPDTFDQPVIAEVAVGQTGDVLIPTEGDRVIVGYRSSGRPIVLGSRYSLDASIPDFEPGERVIGHPLSDAHVRLASDGSVRAVGDSGNTITLESDGSVTINDGSTRPVTDVDFSNETVTRASDVYVPSQ